MNQIYKKHVSTIKVDFHLQPLTSIHLHSNLQVDLTGAREYSICKHFFYRCYFYSRCSLYQFYEPCYGQVGTQGQRSWFAQSSRRRKRQLIRQFLGESLLISFFALLISIGLVLAFLPVFNNISEKNLSIHFLDGKLLLSLLGIAVVTGLISGSYPALFLSGFLPVKVLKGNMKSMGGNLLFRNGLVVTQFIVSIVLLVGTVVVYKQLKFIREKNLGFDKENLLYMNMTGDMWNKQQALKSELQRNPLTSNFTIISDIPTNLTSGTVTIQWEGKDPKSQVVFPSMYVSEDFIDVFQMKILNGRSFSKSFKGDSSNYIVNEKALQVMGMTVSNAVGKPLSFQGNKGTIIGVVKDFNFKPIQQPIEPLVLCLNRYGGVVVVRTHAG